MLFNTQEEREAFLNLLLLARFCDKKLTITEENSFNEIFDKLQWADYVSPANFISSNITRAREALQTEELMQAYIDKECEAFTTETAKATVLEKLAILISSDGIHQDEKAMYKKIEIKLR